MRCHCIWRYQRHSTACDGTVNASDAPFTTSSSNIIAVVKFRRIGVFMRRCERDGIQTAAAACCKTARQTTILMAACPQLMRRTVDSRAIAWRRAGTDSPTATSPYIHWIHGRCWIYSWNIVQTKMKNKIQTPKHFKVKLNFSFWPNWTWPDPTRPFL